MATPAVSAVEPLWLKNARELVGLREIVGSKNEPKVLEFFKEAGHPEIHNDETAWCAAFANSMLRRAGFAGTGALNARSFLTWGTKLDVPKPGCIVVFKRGNSEWEGHVAFFLRDLGNGYLEVLGGNQGNAVSIARHAKADLLGYRWPLISAVTPKPVVVVAPAPAKAVLPADKKTVAKGAAGTAILIGVGKGAHEAAKQGVSAMEICLWIFGLTALAVGIFVIGYHIIKGHWPWKSISTGNQSQAPLPLSLPQSEKSLELASVQLGLSSADLPVTPSPQPSVSKPRQRRSVKPSQKTRKQPAKFSSLKRNVGKKSSPKRKSKSKN